ncbi:MAG: hypothetical protein KME64_15355 [Scytonematopsis contorta HA4267-MV1]|jgi:glycosyltransferase involved in cell wall biosynthesis|nr:hypothetical protein [Scytonematopsis contorta HA4267-MV1]
MANKKIAFIHYPYAVNAARIDSMPFALNSIIYLAKYGWEIDLYLWENSSEKYRELFPENVTLKYLKEPNIRQFGRARYTWLKFRFIRNKKYHCVFGVGQIGAYIAWVISKNNYCPFIYLNDEFPSFWGDSIWSKSEKLAAKEAAMLILPDSQRINQLLEEMNLPSSTPAVGLPNIPIIKPSEVKIDWYKRLGIPHDSIPFLHAGTLEDWAQIPEILCSVPSWPEKAVLILHSRDREKVESYRQQLSHLDVPGKVFWSYNNLSEDELHSLIKFCCASFALYRNTGPNFKYVGLSSGKLMRGLACGCPVIASNFTSLAFVKEYQLGVLVNHSVEISKAVEEIIFNRDIYTNKCLDFCTDIASFEKAWSNFCHQLKEITQLDLMSGE